MRNHDIDIFQICCSSFKAKFRPGAPIPICHQMAQLTLTESAEGEIGSLARAFSRTHSFYLMNKETKADGKRKALKIAQLSF